MFNIRQTPEFSWSFSRESIFNKCKRQYFYNYYGSHNGWLRNDPKSYEIYKYKNVTNLQMSFGMLFHDLIKRFIKSGTTAIDTAGFLTALKANLHTACVKGSNIKNWTNDPKNNQIMMEILYGNGEGWKSKYSKDNASAVNSKMSRCINVFKTESIQDILTNNIQRIVEVDEDLSAGDYSRLLIDNITTFAKIDFLYIRNDGKWVIADWKTNKNDFTEKDNQKDIRQLYLYAYYVHNKYNIDYSNMICRFENVITGNSFILNNIDMKEITNVENSIKYSMEDMSSYVENGDLVINSPLDKSTFNRNPGSDEKNCSGCKFRAICS